MSAIDQLTRHVSASAVARPQWSRTAIRLALLSYGIVFAVYAAAHFASVLPNDETMMGTRVQGVQASIAVLDHGGPPLLGASRTYGGPGTVAARDYFPVGVTDDQGIYLYLPILGEVTGTHDPHVLLKWFFIGCFVLLFALYPLLFYEIFGSVLAGLAAPILVLHWFHFLRNTDLYWVSGWCVLLGLPLVFLAFRRAWDRWSIGLLAAAAVIASFSTSVRIHSGLPIVIAAIAVALLKAPSWRQRGLVAAIVLVASFSISVGVFDAVRVARDHQVGVAFRKTYPSQHPFWHNAYIGLGYLPNKYGITWDDTVSINAVRRANPHAGYLTPEYEATLRHIYFKLFRHDPSFVLDTFWTKFGVCLADARRQFDTWWLLALAAAMIVGRRRRDMQWYMLLMLPAVALTLLPPVLTVPFVQYEAGWLTTIGFAWMLVVLWLLASLPDALVWADERVRALRDGARIGWRDEVRGISGGPRAIVVTLVLAAALLTLSVPAIAHANDAQRTGFYRTNASPLTSGSLAGRQLDDWSFAGGLPSDWERFSKAQVGNDADRTEIRTRSSIGEYQVWSPNRTLRRGSYAVVVGGRVLSGGMTVGVLDATTQTWIAQTNYWSGSRFGSGRMETSFTVPAPTTVQLILANWASPPGPSTWRVDRVRLLEEPHS